MLSRGGGAVWGGVVLCEEWWCYPGGGAVQGGGAVWRGGCCPGGGVLTGRGGVLSRWGSAVQWEVLSITE